MDPRIEEAQELVMSLKSKSQARNEKLLRKEKKYASNNNSNNNNNNNNNEDFKSNYATSDHDHSPSGRLSRNSGSGSNESAFSSSEGEDSEDNQTNCEHQSMSSGRSSADQSVVSSSSASDGQLAASSGDNSNVHEPPEQLNTVCNLVPFGNPIARDLVEQVRCKFLDSLRHPESQSLVDKYEQVDLVELKRGFLGEDLDESGRRVEQSLAFRLISRFINFKELIELETKRRNNNNSKLQNTNDHDDQKALLDKALDDATSKLKELLLFRRQYRLSQALDDQFCKEMHMLHGIFPFGHDKNHLPVLYLRARIHRRWSRGLDDMFRRYVAWQVNLLTKSYPGAQVKETIGRNAIEKDGSFGICFDCLSVSYSCVDMDFLSYLVKILVNYYPTYCRYALCVDLPWLFRSVWKMVRSWLPEDARNTVHLITSKQLVEFIDEDQIPNSIRINELPAHEKPDSLKHKLPKNIDSIRSIEQIAKDLNVSSSEVKQFKAHVDKVRKEYQQLGAI